MTTTDWIIDVALVLIVVRQLREEQLTARFLLLPVGIVAFVAHEYLHSVPTAGHDLWLVVLGVSLGTGLGLAGGLLTTIRAEGGHAYVRAGWGAAGLWVVSMGARLGFIVWITHPAGGAALTRFSVAHDITGGQVWQSALVLLALSEVLVRIGVIAVRGSVLAARSTSAPAKQFATV